MNIAIQGFTGVYMGEHSNTGGFTEAYMGVHVYTGVYRSIHGCT